MTSTRNTTATRYRYADDGEPMRATTRGKSTRKGREITMTRRVARTVKYATTITTSQNGR